MEWLVLWEEKEVRVEASTESGEADHIGLGKIIMNFKMNVQVLKDKNLGATGWSARSERIANIARGARADCTVVPRLQHHMDELFLSGFKILLFDTWHSAF